MFSSGLVMSGAILFGMVFGVIFAIILSILDGRLALGLAVPLGILGLYFGVNTAYTLFFGDLSETLILGIDAGLGHSNVYGGFIMASAVSLGLATGSAVS